MSRPRSGVGAELVPLVLILAGLAGSLALIVAVHRRSIAPKPTKAAVAVALPPAASPPRPSPVAVPPPVVAAPEAEEPEPPPPPAPEDPTPKVVARIVAEEAEQLLQASRADRRAAELDRARKAAELESEKWRRRESLVRLQLDSLDSKVRKMESQLDEMALERDALERERDARKAMAAKARSRPGQAILPHRGQNGTWRRPIVIECANGTATLQPQGVGFGLLEMAAGFGPASNPFVATIAAEAVRVQGSHSPDGQQVVPYIFFLVRPDGIRAYYEARGRLEPLGITFGYELADQDWEVEFPDLDDVQTWDGSPSSRPDPLDATAQAPATGRPPGGSPAEDDDFPAFGGAGRGRSTPRDDLPGGEFTWPPRSRSISGGGGPAASRGPDSTGNGPGPRPGGLRFSNSAENRNAGLAGGAGEMDGGPTPAARVGLGGNGPDAGPRPASRAGLSGLAERPAGAPGTGKGSGTGGEKGGDSSVSPAPRELALGAGPISPLTPSGPAATGRRSGSVATGDAAPAGGVELAGPSAAIDDPTAPALAPPSARGQADPANTFVWPSKPAGGPAGRPAGGVGGGDSGDVDRSPPARHVGPFSRPLAMGLDPVLAPQAAPAAGNPPTLDDPTRPDGPAGEPGDPRAGLGSGAGGASKPRGAATQADARGIGQGGTPGEPPPPPGAVGVGMPGMTGAGTPPPGMTSPPPGMTPPAGDPRRSTASPALPELPPGSIVNRRFEVVLVCGPRGVIVQPGGYRVTSDALKDRDGLLKKQIVALVKARRTADPKVVVEPRVRFLVQPGGDANYWAARGQFLMSGLDWPVSTQVAEPDHPNLMPSESW